MVTFCANCIEERPLFPGRFQGRQVMLCAPCRDGGVVRDVVLTAVEHAEIRADESVWAWTAVHAWRSSRKAPHGEGEGKAW